MVQSTDALNHTSLEQAVAQLAAVDKDLASVAERLGVPPLWDRAPGFATLVHIILEQQISIKAAHTMFQRLNQQLGVLSPQTVLDAGNDGLRNLGLSRPKARYCLELASRIDSDQLDLEELPWQPVDHGRQALLAVPGLGPWSVDVYYMTALCKPDVWPYGDLALADAMADLKGLDAPASRSEQARISQSWSPWRSVAARLLWAHYLDARGQYSSS